MTKFGAVSIPCKRLDLFRSFSKYNLNAAHDALPSRSITFRLTFSDNIRQLELFINLYRLNASDFERFGKRYPMEGPSL